MKPPLRYLEVLSILELLSIAVLSINAATLHLREITSAMGPAHGALYLAVAVTAIFGAHLRLRTRLCAFIPVLGGILTLLNVRAERANPRTRSPAAANGPIRRFAAQSPVSRPEAGISGVGPHRRR